METFCEICKLGITHGLLYSLASQDFLVGWQRSLVDFIELVALSVLILASEAPGKWLLVMIQLFSHDSVGCAVRFISTIISYRSLWDFVILP